MRDFALVLHRWVNDQAQYERYPNPDGLDLVFVTAAGARGHLPAGAAAVLPVACLDDPAEVLTLVDTIVRRRGRPSRIIALNEADLLSAAALREDLDVPGDTVARTLVFRDKLTMMQRLRDAAAVPVPEFAAVSDRSELHELAAGIGYPVVLKPRLGTASRGVQIVHSPLDPVQVTEPSVAQAYCGDQVAHVDGWWDGTALGEWRPSLYVNDCASFGASSPLGSYEITDPGLRARIQAATEVICLTLTGSAALVFHLELFVNERSVQFLEIAARVGGAEVPFVWREVHGLDLLEVAWSVQMGLPIDADRARRDPTACPRGAEGVAGWLLTHGSWDNVLPPGAYWGRGTDAGPAGAGIYEGAPVRLRFTGPSDGAVAASVRGAIRRVGAGADV